MNLILSALENNDIYELTSKDKYDAIIELSEYLLMKLPENQKAKFKENIINREKQFNSALGYGIACPHIRAYCNDRIQLVLGWSKNGIDFNATDKEKVNLLLMFFIPDRFRNIYLEELSNLVNLVKKNSLNNKIKNIENINEVRDFLINIIKNGNKNK